MSQGFPTGEMAEWLTSIRLVSTAERILTFAIAGLTAVVLLLSLRYETGSAVVLAASHAAIAVAGAFGARRPWTWRLFGLVVISLVHLAVFLMMAMPGIWLLAWIYGVVGTACMVAMLPILRIQKAFLGRLGNLTDRDDFKWAITEAPLSLRFELARRIQQVMDAEFPG